MASAGQTRDRYLVKSLVHSSQLLGAFHSPGEALPLKEICARCGLPKTMAFRLLYTLEKCGMIDKVGQNLYQSRVRSEEHTSELQSRRDLVCRLLLEKKKKKKHNAC